MKDQIRRKIMTEVHRWSAEKAWNWYQKTPCLCGFNFLPSTAVNTTEMWQAETFDLETIDRELGWAGEIGFNTCRVFVQYLVWDHDPQGMLQRMEQFLEVASQHGLSTMYTLFDDCAFSGKQPYLGKQDDPLPGVHNSGWTPSPGHQRAVDQSAWPRLEEYVRSVVSCFRQDRRVIAWDLFNEPGNSGMGNKSLPLLINSFGWARAAHPEQPLLAGLWQNDMTGLNDAILKCSDLVSFHCYSNLGILRNRVAELKLLVIH